MLGIRAENGVGVRFFVHDRRCDANLRLRGGGAICDDAACLDRPEGGCADAVPSHGSADFFFLNRG
jgi:hypothetical protein